MSELTILEKDYKSFISEKTVRERLKLPEYVSSDLVEDLIQCSVDAAEGFLRFALVKQIVVFKYGNFTGEVKLPIRHFSKLNKLTVSSECGKALAVTDWKVSSNTLHIDLPLHFSAQLEVEYVAEYSSLLPAEIKQGVLKHMSNIYDKGILSLCADVTALYQSHRISLL